MEYPLKEFFFAFIYVKSTNFFSIPLLQEYVKKLESETKCKITTYIIDSSEIEEKLPKIEKLNMITCLPNDVPHLQKFLEKFKNLTWVHSMFSGVDKFLSLKEISENNKIILTNARGAYAEPLAEYTILSLLYFNYNVPFYINSNNNKNWQKITNTMVDKKTIIIIGYGKNGIAIAKKVKNAFNMYVISFVRKYRENIEGKEYCDEIYGFENLQDEKILKKADFILATLPGTNETKGIFNKKFFEKMKKDSVFINIGRGSAVIEKDLINVLNENIIRGAVLDVCQHEPLDKNDELYNVPREKLLITNHCGDVTTSYFDQSYKVLFDNMKSFIEKGELVTVVKKDLGY